MRRLAVVLLLLLALAAPCRATGGLWDELGLDGLAEAGKAYGAEVELSEGLSVHESASALAEMAKRELPPLLKSGVRSALLVVVIALFCALAQGAAELGEDRGVPVTVLAGALAITAVSAGQAGSLLRLGRETARQMASFAQTLLPVSAACAAAGGQVAGAAARQVATAAFSSLLMTAIDRLMVPLVYAFLAAALAFAVTGNRGLKQVGQLIRWTVNTALTILLVGFSIYLTVSGAIAGTADAAAVKAARTAISAAVPVVGRLLSDTAETVLVGAGLLKNAAGLFGMVTVLTICLVPFLRLGIHYLAFKLSGALASAVADSRLAGLIEQLGEAFGMILGMTGACTLQLLISIVSGMTGGLG